MKKVLISRPLTPQRLASLQASFQVDCVATKGDDKAYQEVWDRIPEYDGLMALGLRVDAPLLDRATRLKIVSNYGVGYDNIDSIYAAKKNIMVTNTPLTTSEPTANLAMGIILSLLLKITQSDRSIRANQHSDWYNNLHPGTSPKGKVLGIIGMGRIGKALAERARVFGFSIVYFKRNPLSAEEEQRYQARYLPLEQLLAESDVISIHTPLNDSTRGLIDTQALTLMKDTAFLVNTARGGVIDQTAIIEALQTNQIAGAGLDVFWEEPEVPAILKTMDNVLLTPHIGTSTREARSAMFQEAFGQIVLCMEGKQPTSVVNF